MSHITSVLKRMKYILIFIGAYFVFFVLSGGSAVNWYDIVMAKVPITLVLTSFLHFDIMHLLSNVQGMLIFGWVLCSNISYRKANGPTLPLLLSISSVVTGILPYYLDLNAYTAGASGAAYALEAYVFAFAFLGGKDPLAVRLRQLSGWLAISAVFAVLWFFNSEVSFVGHFSGAIVGVVVALVDLERRKQIKRINDERKANVDSQTYFQQ